MNIMSIIRISDSEVKTIQLFGMVKCNMFARRAEGGGMEMVWCFGYACE